MICSISCPFYKRRHCTHVLAETQWEKIILGSACKIEASENADKATIKNLTIDIKAKERVKPIIANMNKEILDSYRLNNVLVDRFAIEISLVKRFGRDNLFLRINRKGVFISNKESYNGISTKNAKRIAHIINNISKFRSIQKELFGNNCSKKHTRQCSAVICPNYCKCEILQREISQKQKEESVRS